MQFDGWSLYLKNFHLHHNPFGSRFHISILQIRKLKTEVINLSKVTVSGKRARILSIHTIVSAQRFYPNTLQFQSPILFFHSPHCFTYRGLHRLQELISYDFYFISNRCAQQVPRINRRQILFIIKTLHQILFLLHEVSVHFVLLILQLIWPAQELWEFCQVACRLSF